jgi:hypothetical protein
LEVDDGQDDLGRKELEVPRGQLQQDLELADGQDDVTLAPGPPDGQSEVAREELNQADEQHDSTRQELQLAGGQEDLTHQELKQAGAQEDLTHQELKQVGEQEDLTRQEMKQAGIQIEVERGEFELAGGLEDWENVDSADVDRYGFITKRGPVARGLREGMADMTTDRLSPTWSRKRNVLTKRPHSAHSHGTPMEAPNRNISARSLNTQASRRSTASRRTALSTIRQATNRLPHNKERRWMDEAGHMLSLAPGLPDIAENEEITKISEALKRKEWERSEKWRKMAKVIRKGKDGEGMVFDFDSSNQKLVDRTWKGIPDRWRSSAWYSFLANSAKKLPNADTDEHLMAEFDRLQDVSSPDDGQIDLDVPRTVNGHVMFRKRNRGGQRLLFRVLHAISLHFPQTGYVQGMASIAATLLCYYEEERCFVMLVRMWQFRGLDQLYQPGFDGLMVALKDFETSWLQGKDATRKLVSPDIYLGASAVSLTCLLERALHRTHNICHAMVPHSLQPIHSLSCSAAGMGCVHATGRMSV